MWCTWTGDPGRGANFAAVSHPPPPIARLLDLGSVAEASEVLAASLDPDYVLANLLRVAMSRLLVARGAVLLADVVGAAGATFRVAAVKGAVALAPGDGMEVSVEAEVAEGDALPAHLRAAGLDLLLPIRHHGRTLGLLALGPRATGAALGPAEAAFARSLAGVAGPALHAARTARDLQIANRALEQRVHALDTLFELAQALGAELEAERVLQTLGFALMGHLTVRRYAVLVGDGTDRPPEEVAARGLAERLDDALRARLGALDGPLMGDDALAEQGLAFAVPLTLGGQRRGALAVGPRATGRPFDADDAQFVGALGALALGALDRATLVESRLEKERLEEEMRLARGIQERLQPRKLPDVPGLDLAVCARPSRVVAGDYVDLVPLPDGRLVVAVGDVSGKGAPAALLMANLQACLRLLALEMAEPRTAVRLGAATARLNRVICQNTDPAHFITFVWGVWDGQRLRYVNAGHNPPRLVRSDGQMEWLSEGGPLLGVVPGAPYAQGEVALAPGDVIALYTDGLTEAMDARREEYGEARLDAVLATHHDEGADAVLGALCADVERFAGAGPLADDLTLLVLKRTG